jgi:hypothetical protein
MANGETKVQFSLWAVLAFVVALGFITAQYISAEQKETKAKQQSNTERIVCLETQFVNIARGLEELKQGQAQVLDALLKSKARRETQ